MSHFPLNYLLAGFSSLIIPEGTTVVLIETDGYAGNTMQDVCLAVFGQEYCSDLREGVVPGYAEDMERRGYEADYFFSRSMDCMSEYGDVISSMLQTPGTDKNGNPRFDTVGLFFGQELSGHDLSQIRDIAEIALKEHKVNLLNIGQVRV